MRVEFFPPDPVTEPRYWVRHEEGLAMMLGPGSIELGSQRSSMERIDYAAGDLGMCPHHEEKWVGLMNTPHVHLSISGEALMAAVDAERAAGFPSGRLFLDYSLGIEMVPRLIKEYRRKHPRIQFTLLVQRSGEMLMKELVAGSIDLCLSVPGRFGQNDVRWSHLLDEELLIALPTTHRLAARRTLNMRELSSEPFLALSPEHTLRIIFDKVCAEASFSPKIALEGMDIATLRGLIGAGLGIGLFPPAPARFAGVVEIKLSSARPIRPLGIGWVDDRYLPASAIEFRKFVVSKFHGD